jgi:photosystem II stability/assembly factor-like uncharacterized protein
VGTKVPRDFVPASATFISDSVGWVLGTSPCPSGTGDCDVVARTRDGGLTWKAIPSPKTSPDRLAQIRFADVRNGFITGNELWATHDSGATWKVVPAHRDVNVLEAAGGRVWVLREGRLQSAPVSGGAFTTEQGPSGANGLVLHGDDAYVTQSPGTDVFRGAHGRPFQGLTTPCATDEGTTLGVADARSWLLLCVASGGAGHQEKRAYTTSNAGGSWLKRADPPQVTGATLGLTTDGYFVIDNTGVSVTRDGGKTWQSSLTSSGGLSGGGFESARLGFVIGGFAASNDVPTMQITRDGGRHWKDVTF